MAFSLLSSCLQILSLPPFFHVVTCPCYMYVTMSTKTPVRGVEKGKVGTIPKKLECSKAFALNGPISLVSSYDRKEGGKIDLKAWGKKRLF